MATTTLTRIAAQTQPRQAETTQTEAARRGDQYLTWIRETLHDKGRFQAKEREIKKASREFAKAHRDELKATWRGGLTTLGKTLAAIILPIVGAQLLASAGFWYLGLLLLPVVGIALYGLSSIVHDTVHNAFVPSKRWNRIIGRVLAPVVLLDWASFRKSHMEHHRQSQSITKDPKYPKLPERSSAAAGGRLRRALKAIAGGPIRLWYGAARRIQRLPPGGRRVFYASSIFLLGLPIVAFFGGEVSFKARNWRRPATWISLFATLGLPALLFAISPFLGLFFIAALWIAMGFFFGVFMTHLSPFQLYPAGDNPSVHFFALNISDIRVGKVVEVLGNAFTEHHCAHHLVPYVPCYNLSTVGGWLSERFATEKAPTLALTTTHDLNLVGDALMYSLVNPPGTSLITWQTVAGEVTRRRWIKDD